MDKVEKIKVKSIINNISYPTNFEEILESVRRNGATNNELHIVQRLPKKLFINPSDLSKEIDNITL